MDDLGNDAIHKETVRLWRAWRTVHEMVADRVSLLTPSIRKLSLSAQSPCGLLKRGEQAGRERKRETRGQARISRTGLR